MNQDKSRLADANLFFVKWGYICSLLLFHKNTYSITKCNDLSLMSVLFFSVHLFWHKTLLRYRSCTFPKITTYSKKGTNDIWLTYFLHCKKTTLIVLQIVNTNLICFYMFLILTRNKRISDKLLRSTRIKKKFKSSKSQTINRDSKWQDTQRKLIKADPLDLTFKVKWIIF